MATKNLLDEKELGKSDAKDQETVSNWELSVLEKELSSENDTEKAPNLSVTGDATTFLVTFNSDQFPVSSNLGKSDRTVVAETANDGTK